MRSYHGCRRRQKIAEDRCNEHDATNAKKEARWRRREALQGSETPVPVVRIASLFRLLRSLGSPRSH